MLLQYSAAVLILTLYSSVVMSQNTSDTTTQDVSATNPPQTSASVSVTGVPKLNNTESNDLQSTEDKITTNIAMDSQPTRSPTTKSSTTRPPLLRTTEQSHPSEQKAGKSGVSRQSASLILSTAILLSINILV